MPIRAVVWGENVHERKNKVVAGIYPDGMHATIAAALNADVHGEAIAATTATLQEPEHGSPGAASPRPTCCSGGATPLTATSTTPWSSGWPRRSGPAWA